MAELHPWSSARGLAQPFIAAYAHTGVSGASVLEALRSVGLGYREGSFYADWRTETGLAKGEWESRRLLEGTVPPERLMAPTEWPGMTSKYLYTAEYTAYSRTTGAYESAYVGVSSDRSLTVGEILDRVQDQLADIGEYEDTDASGVAYIGGRKRSW